MTSRETFTRVILKSGVQHFRFLAKTGENNNSRRACYRWRRGLIIHQPRRSHTETDKRAGCTGRCVWENEGSVVHIEGVGPPPLCRGRCDDPWTMLARRTISIQMITSWFIIYSDVRHGFFSSSTDETPVLLLLSYLSTWKKEIEVCPYLNRFIIQTTLHQPPR